MCYERLTAAFRITLFIVLYSASFSLNSFAKEPQYAKTDFKNVPAIEVKGTWDEEAQAFIARKLEILPKVRRPKLRGEIQNIDLENGTIRLFGIDIEIDDDTQFFDSDLDIRSLKEGQKVEVSCKIREKGRWEASKVKINDIKDSDKIKGSITGISVDNIPPDTLEINGLIILLNQMSKVIEPSGSYQIQEDKLFDDLRSSKLNGSSDIYSINNMLYADIEYRHSTKNRQDYDLSESLDMDNSDTEPELRFQSFAVFNENLQAFGQLRLRKKYIINDVNDNNLIQLSDEFEADITQLYLLARNIGGKGIAIKAGRQDFEDDREWLFDDYLDAIKIYYYGIPDLTFESAFIHGVSPLKDKFENWTDVYFKAIYSIDQSDIYLFALNRKDTDIRNREPLWVGFGYSGNLANFKPWFVFSKMDGEDKGRSLDASAYDLGVVYAAQMPNLRPSVSIGYAVGTGDKNGADNVSNEFRQTGYEDNVGYLNGITSVHYYGELLNPELSNIKILSFGAGIQPYKNSSIEILYHTYEQDQPDNDLRSDLYLPPAREEGDIGWELDIVLGISNIWDRLSITWVTGLFDPGESYIPRTQRAILNKFNIKIDL